MPTPPGLAFFMNGGEGEIRTHGTDESTHAFQACALNHSATSPLELPAKSGSVPHN